MRRALVAIVLLLLEVPLTQAKDLSSQAKSVADYKIQQNRVNEAIDAAEKFCLTGDRYKFTVDSSNNLKILNSSELKSLTIDRSKALTGSQFFQNDSVRSLVDSDVRNCMRDQWKTVLLATDTGSPVITLPSRMFAGPGQYPPREFRAYGIVAFNSLPTGPDKNRYAMICDAYVSALLYFKDVQAPLEKQMVTVWPVDTTDVALKVSTEPREKVCGDAVPHYGLSIAQDAILAARKSPSDLAGTGPFLLAWSPGAAEGKRDALVLVADMSNVINNAQAKQVFEQWKTDITERPALWDNWDEAHLILIVRLWADKLGTNVLQLFGTKS